MPSEPKIVAAGHKVHAMDWPLETHWRKATCKEIACTKYVMGFTTLLDETQPKQAEAAGWIRYKSGLKFAESKDDAGQLTRFEFPSGQECWEGSAGLHRVKTGRPEELSLHRVNKVPYAFIKGIDFNESMNEENYQVQRLIERG